MYSHCGTGLLASRRSELPAQPLQLGFMIRCNRGFQGTPLRYGAVCGFRWEPITSTWQASFSTASPDTRRTGISAAANNLSMQLFSLG